MKNQKTSFLLATIAELPEALKELNFSKEIVEQSREHFRNQVALSFLDTFGSIASALRGAFKIPDGVAQDVVLTACQLAHIKQLTSEESYRDALLKKIRKAVVGRVYGEAVIRYEHCMGTLKACFAEREIFCTPFWEGAEGIAFEEYDTNGANTFEPYVLPFNLTGSLEQDVKAFEKAIEEELRIFTPKKKFQVKFGLYNSVAIFATATTR